MAVFPIDLDTADGYRTFLRVKGLPSYRFVGRTALGPVGCDDVMEVTAWQPPVGEGVGRCEVVKLGRVLRGRAWFEVVPRGGSTTLVRWAEDVTLALPLGRRVQRLLDPVMRGGLVRVLGRLAEDVGGGSR